MIEKIGQPLIPQIAEAKAIFKHHYAVDAEELYLPNDWRTGVEKEILFMRGAPLNLLPGMRLTLFGMDLYYHDGPIMLINRKRNRVFGIVNGQFVHAVHTGDGAAALWREVPQ